MDDRIQDLEVKLAYLEKHLADLDDVVRALAEQVQRQADEIASLRDRTERAAPEDEKPPHY